MNIGENNASKISTGDLLLKVAFISMILSFIASSLPLSTHKSGRAFCQEVSELVFFLLGAGCGAEFAVSVSVAVPIVLL